MLTYPRGFFGGDEQGQTLIETAIAFPILGLMLFGFIDFSLIMFELSNLTYATHTAVRYASLHSQTSSSPATAATVTSMINPFIPAFPTNVSSVALTYPSTGSNTVGGTVQVQVVLTYNMKLPFYTLSNLTVYAIAQGVIVN